MTHPTDAELEAMAMRLDAEADRWRSSSKNPTVEDEAAAMLRACKGRVRALEWRDSYGVL